jgi:hypothetical protein
MLYVGSEFELGISHLLTSKSELLTVRLVDNKKTDIFSL